MKMFIKSACIAFVIAVLYSVIPFQASCSDISDEVFRLHILANSDSAEDQALKLSVRDKVLEYTEDLYNGAESKQTAERITGEYLRQITEIAANEIKARGFSYSVKAEIKKMYFSTRVYSDYTLPAGMYDALRITIGKGEGHNWWCVMYPSLCVSAAVSRDEKAREVFNENEYQLVKSENTEYKFKIVEIFEQIKSYFNQ